MTDYYNFIVNMLNNSEHKLQTATVNLIDFSFEELNKKIDELFNHEWFTNFYIYNLECISTMLYYTLRNKDIMDVLSVHLDDSVYHGLYSQVGIAMTKYEGVDEFGHSGYSMAQTVFITQKIIKKGLQNVADFYKNKELKHPMVSDNN